ncbi:glycogen debranching protein [Dictyobacter alpinus]|uniref:Glycogen debranching protein n=1 Tax=Dictyobacter alpinus TaxID=2014873 RepID=A0A402B568_9CHLR|nr:amylo-alpha-1,6-glucosidase [Dictyobacter alpinus]GCE26490.1 glycogen debranching protein [Dictyobacter alpinus]
MTISFDRSTCCDLNETISREWLVTNGLGGYAAGTVAGVLTRIQHGLLVAIPPRATKPQLLLAKIDEEVTFDQRTYYLGTNEYRDGTFNPSGFVHIEAFRLENGFPVFTYRLGGIDGMILEKRIWMAQNYNTTYIQYRVIKPDRLTQSAHKVNSSVRSSTNNNGRSSSIAEQARPEPMILTLLPLATYRPFDLPQRGNTSPPFHIQVHGTENQASGNEKDSQLKLPAGIAGSSIFIENNPSPYHLLAIGQPEMQATFIPTGVWYWNFLRRCDTVAGQPDTDDLYLPGVIRAALYPDSDAVLTIVVSAEELSSQLYQQETISLLYKKEIERRQSNLERALKPQQAIIGQSDSEQDQQLHLLPLTTTSDPYAGGQNYLQQLLNASEYFVAHYSQSTETKEPGRENRPTFRNSIPRPKAPDKLQLIANYFALENKTRDALIAMPGVLLVTERYQEAQNYLQDLANYFIGGILPDRLPTAHQPLTDHDYSSADITLWYFYALDHYIKVTQHYEFLEELFPRLAESINCYIQGTHNGIQLDTADGLLRAEKTGKALTWMNEYHNGKPVTPRSGKPVELNALWYYALVLMQGWSERLGYIGHIGYSASIYQQHANRCKHNFQQRYWNPDHYHLYDVIDGPEGDDASLRVNQLFAIALPHAVLEQPYRQHVFEAITQHLVTPYGLRTLAPKEAGYQGHLEIDIKQPAKQHQSLHQGSSWVWLIGPYIDAMLSQWGEPGNEQDSQVFKEYLWRKGMQLLEPLQDRFTVGLLGTCENVFDGDSPQHPSPQAAGLLSSAELLRSYNKLVQMRIEHTERLLLSQ